MNNFDQKWQRLTAAARRAPAAGDEAAPQGFATRVAARALEAPPAGPWFGVERLALRGLLAACALCAASVAFHYATGELTVEGEDEALIEFVNTDYELS
jgi:hypothetical protein